MVYSDQSGVGHGITWRHALSAKRVQIEGATAFAVSGLFLLYFFTLTLF